MTARKGFTLIEVITAITLTAIVLGIAVAALGAAASARATVLAHQNTLEAESRVRTLLTDMLQHAPASDAVDGPLLTVDRSNGETQLMFLSTGVREPFGTGGAWRVRVAPGDSGLSIDAAPMDAAGGDGGVHALLPNVRTFDVRVLDAARTGELAQWRTDWPVAKSRPRLVELQFGDGNGGAARSPLVVSLSPLEEER